MAWSPALETVCSITAFYKRKSGILLRLHGKDLRRYGILGLEPKLLAKLTYKTAAYVHFRVFQRTAATAAIGICCLRKSDQGNHHSSLLLLTHLSTHRNAVYNQALTTHDKLRSSLIILRGFHRKFIQLFRGTPSFRPICYGVLFVLPIIFIKATGCTSNDTVWTIFAYKNSFHRKHVIIIGR